MSRSERMIFFHVLIRGIGLTIASRSDSATHQTIYTVKIKICRVIILTLKDIYRVKKVAESIIGSVLRSKCGASGYWTGSKEDINCGGNMSKVGWIAPLKQLSGHLMFSGMLI
jgi:hypothetical protein